MAQGSKSRIVIWAIVGILIVVAAVMLIKKPKVEGKPVNAEQFARTMESRLQKFENKIAQARVEFPGAPAEQWQKMTDDIARGRQLVTEMAALTEQKDLQLKKDEVWKAYNGARKTLKEITGKSEPDESAGGE